MANTAGARTAKETHTVIRTVTDYFWRFNCKWAVTAYAGPDPAAADAVTVRGRSCEHEIKTGAKRSPRPDVRIAPPVEVNLSWLLSRYDSERQAYKFKICRESARSYSL